MLVDKFLAAMAAVGLTEFDGLRSYVEVGMETRTVKAGRVAGNEAQGVNCGL